MPLQNDFLTFAAATGANVLDQADYAAAAATSTGYTQGVASSAAVNKTLRQTSIMAAMIAKFIVDEAGTAVVDDGTIPTIEANFIAAIRAVAGTLDITIPDVDGLTAALAGKLPSTGTAVAATKLATSRSFNLTGVVTADAVGFNGTGNVTLGTAIADGALSIAKTSGLQDALDSKASLNSGPTFTGVLTAAGILTSNGVFGRASIGSLNWTATGDATYQMQLTSSGNLSVVGAVSGAGLISTNGTMTANAFGWSSPFQIILRPQGIGSSTNQVSIATNGTMSLVALAASGAITGASVRATGTVMAAGGFQVG